MNNTFQSYLTPWLTVAVCVAVCGSAGAGEVNHLVTLLPVRTNANLIANVDSKERGFSVDRVATLVRPRLVDSFTGINGVAVSEGTKLRPKAAKAQTFNLELTLDQWSEREQRQRFVDGSTGCRWRVELHATLRVYRGGTGELMDAIHLSSEAFDSRVTLPGAALPEGVGEELLQGVVAELSLKAAQGAENLFFPMAIKTGALLAPKPEN